MRLNGDIVVAQEEELTRLKVEKNQLTFFPFHVTLKSQGVSKQITNSSDEERTMSGFTLNWFLEDSNGSRLTEKLPPRQEDWKQEVPTSKYEQPLSEMVQLIRQLKSKNLTK